MHDNEVDVMVDIPSKRKRPQAHFLWAWMRSPMKMGALVPSSRFLARAMAMQVDKAAEGVVIELGAGTGVMTHELLHSGIAAEKLIVIEREPRLHALLKAHYPKLNIVCADARDLRQVLAAQGIGKVNAIVSSLPLLSMPKEIRRAIVAEMAEAIGKDGRIIQFTYGPKSPIGQYSLGKCSLQAQRVKSILANMPPAHVWVYNNQ